MADWQKENRERVRMYHRARRLIRREDDFSLMREYRRLFVPDTEELERRKEKKRDYRKSYRTENRERIRFYRRAFYHLNKNGDSSLMEAYRKKYAR